MTCAPAGVADASAAKIASAIDDTNFSRVTIYHARIDIMLG
jgi:hypothetical protein